MPRINICLVAPPYAGHLNPLLAMGRELVEIADVTVISTLRAMDSVHAAGLKGHPILLEKESLVWQIASPGGTVKNRPLELFRQLRINVSLLEEILQELDAAFGLLKPDLVIADFTLPVAATAAARHNARWWTSLPSPCVLETPDGPPAYFGGLSPARSWWEQASHILLRKLTRAFKLAMFWVFRRTFHKVGLSSIYRKDGSECVYSPDAILACSIREIEFPRSYPSHLHFTGAFFFTPPVDSIPPPEFEAGKKHILVTLGTHLDHLKNDLAINLQTMARDHPEWVIHFSDGCAGKDNDVFREGNFHRYGFISYDEWLPRYDLVIHHGGAGIMLKCLEQGLRSVVMPVDFDQFDNAARLVHAGLAVRVRSRSGIPAAAQAAMNDGKMAARCREAARTVGKYRPGADLRERIRQAFPL